MRQILNKYNAVELRRFISKANIKGITKMKKADLINEMTKPKHIGRFKHIKARNNQEIKKKKEEEKKKKEAEKKEAEKKKKESDKRKLHTVTKKDIKDLKRPKKQVPTITITEAKKEKKKPTQEIKSSLGKIPTPKIKIRVAPKKAPKKEKKAPKKEKKAPKKEKKNRDVIDDMDDRKEEIKQLRLKIKKTKDTVIKKKLEKELKILKNKPIIEKATIKEAPKRAPPKKDDELEAFLASFK